MNGVVKRGGGGYLHPHQFTMTLEARPGGGGSRSRGWLAQNTPLPEIYADVKPNAQDKH